MTIARKKSTRQKKAVSTKSRTAKPALSSSGKQRSRFGVQGVKTVAAKTEKKAFIASRRKLSSQAPKSSLVKTKKKTLPSAIKSQAKKQPSKRISSAKKTTAIKTSRAPQKKRGEARKGSVKQKQTRLTSKTAKKTPREVSLSSRVKSSTAKKGKEALVRSREEEKSESRTKHPGIKSQRIQSKGRQVRQEKIKSKLGSEYKEEIEFGGIPLYARSHSQASLSKLPGSRKNLEKELSWEVETDFEEPALSSHRYQDDERFFTKKWGNERLEDEDFEDELEYSYERAPGCDDNDEEEIEVIAYGRNPYDFDDEPFDTDFDELGKPHRR